MASKQTFKILHQFKNLKEMYPWLFHQPTKLSKKKEAFFQATKLIFGVDPLKNPLKWAKEMASCFQYGKANLFTEVVQSFRDGKFFQEIKSEAIKSVSEKFTNTTTGMAMISIVNLSFSQFTKLSLFFKFIPPTKSGSRS